MPVFRLTKTSIEALPKTSLVALGVKERADLQRLLKANIEAVAPDVLVIAEEFAEWEDSKRRIDLLGIDRDGNLVVLELKRDDDGSHMELQALRYAAMISSMTFARAAEVFQAFLDRHGIAKDAEAELLRHLGWAEPREEDFARDVRIVLVAPGFSKELTTTVLWLNERDLDITCVRLQSYALGPEVVLDVQPIIPLPETAPYVIQLKQKGQAARREKVDREALRKQFWQELLPAAAKVTPRFAAIAPTDDHFLQASSGTPGLRWEYLVWQDSGGAELYIDKGTDSTAWNKAVFDYLHERREQVEATYGAKLTWYRLDGKRASRVMEESIPGGIKSPRDQWPAVRDAMIDSMRRLEQAIAPHVTSAVDFANRARGDNDTTDV